MLVPRLRVIRAARFFLLLTGSRCHAEPKAIVGYIRTALIFSPVQECRVETRKHRRLEHRSASVLIDYFLPRMMSHSGLRGRPILWAKRRGGL
jgi:hypothetical protein